MGVAGTNPPSPVPLDAANLPEWKSVPPWKIPASSWRSGVFIYFYTFIFFFLFRCCWPIGSLMLPLPLLLFPLPLVLIPEVVIYSLLLAEGEKKNPYFLLELEIKIKTDRLCWKRQITFRNFWWLIQSHDYDPSTLMWVKVFAWRMGNAENAVDKKKKKKKNGISESTSYTYMY